MRTGKVKSGAHDGYESGSRGGSRKDCSQESRMRFKNHKKNIIFSGFGCTWI
jgi:hypothetical protein